MRTCILTAFLLLTAMPARPQQNGEALINAFRTSYTREAEQHYAAAIDALNAVYQAESYELNLRLGWLHYLKGDYPASQGYYQKAAGLLPYAVEAKFGYVLPLAALGNWDEVVRTYEAVLRIDPKNTLAHYRLGAIFYERKDYGRAYQHTEIVVNLYPFDYDALTLFAWIHLQTGKPSRAKALFLKARLIQPDGASALEGLKLIK